MNHATEPKSTKEIMLLINNYSSNIKYLAEINAEYYEGILGGKISMYGIEAAMPKGSDGTSDPVFNEIKRRLKMDKKRDNMAGKVLYIQDRLDRVVDDRQMMVLDMRLKGYKLHVIGNTLNISKQHVYRILVDIAESFKDRRM